MKRISGLFRWLNVLLILATLIAYLSPFVSPAECWPVSVFGLAFPLLFLLNFIFVIFWLIRRNKYFLFSLGCLLLGWNHFHNTVGLNFITSSTTSNQLSIMNFNTRNLSPVYIDKDERVKAKKIKYFEDWIIKNAFDVILFQETAKYRTKRILELMKQPYIYHPDGKSVSIISKYPIINSGNIDFGNRSHLAVWADIKLSAQKIIRFYSLHLKSSNLDRNAIDAVVAGKVKERETWSGIKDLIRDYKNTAYHRADQAEKILEHIRSSPYPVVAGGDFNEPPTSYVYYQFNQYLDDAFRGAGRGLGSTYAGKIPFLKIDYLFHDPHLTIISHNIERMPFSDHYPAKTVLSW